jgi:UDP-glucose 4-epimerase
MKNVLITGGAGFVPSSLADGLLAKSNYRVVLLDNMLTGAKHNIPDNSNCHFIKGDANKYEDLAPIFGRFNFDYVFHYAAVVGVKRTLDNPVMVLEDIAGFKNLLNLAKNSGVERVFFSSSSEVYGEPVELPQNEVTTPLNSKLPYAIVKNVGEAFFRTWKKEYNLDYTLFRFFNTYGPKQSSDFVMSKFIRAALKNEDITIYGDGSQTRTFCYIDDNIEACINALEKNLFVNDVVNIGSDKEMTISQLADIIVKQTNSNSRIIHLPALEEGDMTRRLPDITNMKTLLNRDLTALETGISKVVDEFNKKATI